MKRKCQVCESTEKVGFRFGVNVCSKCSQAFGCYTGRMKRRWTPCSKTCIVRWDTRLCVYCRFKKCLTVGMNKCPIKRLGQPKQYTDEEIHDILHNANMEKIIGTPRTYKCHVCCKETPGYPQIQACHACKEFFIKAEKLPLQQCNENCVVDFGQAWPPCRYCRYQLCLKVGMKQQKQQSNTETETLIEEIIPKLEPIDDVYEIETIETNEVPQLEPVLSVKDIQSKIRKSQSNRETEIEWKQ